MNEREKIEGIIKDLYQYIGFTVEVKVREFLNEDGVVERECMITTSDAQYLIGHHGANLRAVEHLAHVIAHHQGIESRFSIDINDYKSGKKRMLERIARDAATDADRSKKPVVLRPMTSYERRIIHTYLHDDARVTTDSIGEADERKVVVKPESILSAL